MRIIFIRHGNPDYEKDCLTELGHKQAEAAAKKEQERKKENKKTQTVKKPNANKGNAPKVKINKSGK